MSDPKPPSPEGQLFNMMFMSQLAPQMAANMAPAIGNIANAQLRAAQRVSPAYAQLQSDLLETYGPRVAQAELEQNRIADPEYYNLRGLESDKTFDLLNAMSPSGLSGAESAEVERGLNRMNTNTGTANSPSQIGAIKNAMTFGSALQDKQSRFAQALGTATGALPNFKSDINKFNTDFSKTVGQDQSANGFGQDFTNYVGGMQGQNVQALSNRRQWDTRVNDSIGSFCCFIFMEAYGGSMYKIPWFVRASRDIHYTDSICRGYKKMSRWLVPAMRRYKLVNELVFRFMIQPLTNHAGYVYNIKGYKHGRFDTPYKRFWLWIWDRLGQC